MMLITENNTRIIFLIFSLSELMKTRACLHHSNTHHQKHMSQSVTNAGESQWAFGYPAVKPVVWSGNIWIRNERVSQRGLCCVRSLDSLLGWDEDRRMKAWIRVCFSQSYRFWRSGLQRMNKTVSCRNYVAVLMFFIVYCQSPHVGGNTFCGPWQTWQVKVKRFQSEVLFNIM